MSAGSSLDLSAGAGRVEALLKLPEGAPRAAAIVCHPHPLFGGSLHNKVVYQAAAALVDAGFATLRFNFRGVGRSEGKHDGGRGEGEDAVVLLDELASRFPGLPLLAAGYSFGAWVALRAGAFHPRVSTLLGIGIATRYHAYDEVLASPCLTRLIQGERDELGPIEEVRSLAARFTRPVRVDSVPEADHFFASGLPLLTRAVRELGLELGGAAG